MAFDPTKHLMNFKGNPYLPVPARIQWMRDEHPDWSIITTIVEINVEQQYAIFTATIMNTEGRVIATGTNMETVKGFPDYWTKAETGAVGRALAHAGFGTQFAALEDTSERGNAFNGPTGSNRSQPPGGYNNRPAPTNSRMAAGPARGVGFP